MAKKTNLRKVQSYLLIIALAVTMAPMSVFADEASWVEIREKPQIKSGEFISKEAIGIPAENLAVLREKTPQMTQLRINAQSMNQTAQTDPGEPALPDITVNEISQTSGFYLSDTYESGTNGQWFAFKSDINAIYRLTLDIGMSAEGLELFIFEEDLQLFGVDLHNIRNERIQGDIPFAKDAVYYIFFKPYSDEYGVWFEYEIELQYFSSIPDDDAISKPQNLTVTNKTATSADVSWSASTGAASYEVSCNNVITQITGTSATLTGLTPSTQYTVKVRGKNGANTGEWSSPFVFETDAASTSPGAIEAPQNLTVGDKTSTGAAISWNACTGATQYEISCNDAITESTTTSAVLTGLTTGIQYTVKVRGKAGTNIGSWSSPVVFELESETPANQGSMDLTVQTGIDYLVSLKGMNINDSSSTYTFTYDSQKLTLTDFAVQTTETDTSVGAVTGTNITIVSVAAGIVTFKINSAIPTGKVWSGVLTVARLKGTSNGNAALTLTE